MFPPVPRIYLHFMHQTYYIPASIVVLEFESYLIFLFAEVAYPLFWHRERHKMAAYSSPPVPPDASIEAGQAKTLSIARTPL